MRIKKFGVATLVAAAVIAVSAVSAWALHTGEKHADSHYLFDHLQARSASFDAVWVESSLAEMLPTQKFSVNGGPGKSLTSGLVIGRVTDVRGGQGFSNENDAPKSTEVGFDSPKALWRTVEVTVAVEEAWGAVAAHKELSFAVVVDGGVNTSTIMAGLRSLDRVVVSLDRQGRFSYAPGLYSISHSGDLFGTVDARGNIELPVLENAAEFMNGLDTVAELRAEAAKARPVIKLDVVEGVPMRR